MPPKLQRQETLSPPKEKDLSLKSSMPPNLQRQETRMVPPKSKEQQEREKMEQEQFSKSMATKPVNQQASAHGKQQGGNQEAKTAGKGGGSDGQGQRQNNEYIKINYRVPK